MDNLSILVKDTTISINGSCFLFWRVGTSFSTIWFFGVICSENTTNNQTVAVMLQVIPNCNAKKPEQCLFNSVRCNKLFGALGTENIIQ